MKRVFLYVWIAVGIMAVSCSKDTSDNKSDGIIRIVANVAAQVRSPQLDEDGSGNFADGDMLSVFVTGSSLKPISASYEYGSDAFTWSSLRLPGEISNVTFSACYPQQKLDSDGMFEFNSFTAQYKDLLLAPAQSVKVGIDNTIYMSFRHALHCVKLTFVPGDGYTEDDLKALSLTCHAKTTCVIDAAKGAIKEVRDAADDCTLTGSAVSLYLVPQETSGVKCTIHLANESREFTLGELLEQLEKPQNQLESGKESVLTLKIGRKSITVESGAIGSWEDQVTADGEVVIG